MFKILSETKFSALERLLESRLPKSAQIYNALRILQIGRLPPSVSTSIYAFNDNLEETDSSSDKSEAFIVLVQFRKTHGDYAAVLSLPINPTSEMIQAFEEIMDWKLPICFCAVDIRFSSIVADLCKKNGRLTSTDRCDFMTMNISDTRTLQVKPLDASIKIKELSPSDAELVTKRWQYAEAGTQALMEEMIRCTGSAGVYLEDKLVSWVVIFAFGSVNALYTEDAFRGKGYGKLTMQKICQLAGERGLVPNVQVSVGNTPSKSLMKAIGFKCSHNIEWVNYEP